jgi:hypothetical protein
VVEARLVRRRQRLTGLEQGLEACEDRGPTVAHTLEISLSDTKSSWMIVSFTVSPSGSRLFS